MNEQRDEGDANLNGAAIEDGLGAAAQQALAERPDDKGPASASPASAAFGADAGNDPGTATVNEEPAERVCRVHGCEARHDRDYLVCGLHWRMLPSELQGRINAAYRRVKATGLVNREYAKLSTLALNWLNAGGKR